MARAVGRADGGARVSVVLIPLAALALSAVAVVLVARGYGMGWVFFSVAIATGLAGAVAALLSRRFPTWTRVVAVVLGVAPAAFAVYVYYIVSHLPYS